MKSTLLKAFYDSLYIQLKISSGALDSQFVQCVAVGPHGDH